MAVLEYFQMEKILKLLIKTRILLRVFDYVIMLLGVIIWKK
jgi:hypothetical protein